MNTRILEATEFEDAKIVCTMPSGGDVQIFASSNHNGPVIEVNFDHEVCDEVQIRVNGRAFYRGHPN